MTVSRQQALTSWLSQTFSSKKVQLTSLTGDAGFRRYYRFHEAGHSYIAVDSPANYCNNAGFIAMQQALMQQQINVPSIIAMDTQQGFFCLSDLGSHLLADVLTVETMRQLYLEAIELLPNIAQAKVNELQALPIYDRPFIEQELALFEQWLLKSHLGIELTTEQQTKLKLCFEVLIQSALEQPQVTMHRDYHSRNIMMANGQLAVIDFQDAVIGPITYDIVSLLRDCYVRWPEQQIKPLFAHYRQLISRKLSLPDIADDDWQRWFDLMGIQRHLKAAGIFARLYHRDDKSGYLKDIPLTLSYIADIAAKYPQLGYLSELVSTQVLPAMEARAAS